MRELPILMSGPMVIAVREDRKTQTRRVICKEIPWQCEWRFEQYADIMQAVCYDDLGNSFPWYSRTKPRYAVGDHLYVKETHYRYGHWVKNGLTKKTGKQAWKFIAENDDIRFAEEPPSSVLTGHSYGRGWYKRPAIFMPKKLARTWLEVTGVRVERVQEITPQDASEEGVAVSRLRPYWGADSISAFHELWDSLNAKRGYGWDVVNLWCFPYTFRRIDR